MATIDKEFAKMYQKILATGAEYENVRRGVKRLQIPSYVLRHEFKNGFPAVTNKKLFWKGVVGELLWFLKGDTNVKYLNENGIKFWNDDAYNWHVKNGGGLSREEFEEIGEGSVGANYSHQWRNFNWKTDQISDLVTGMHKDIMGSRLVVSAWNPGELNETALPPCHNFFQIIGIPFRDGTFGFELHFNMRSADVFLGVPLNIASYALLAKILEKITGYKAVAVEGTLKCVHLYDNQYGAAREYMFRDPNEHSNCSLVVDSFPAMEDINQLIERLEIPMFNLEGYTHDEPIKVKMLSPKII